MMRRNFSLAAVIAALMCGTAQAQISDGTIKIGVMNDMSGTYSDLSGQGSVIAARMAVEDFGAAAKGLKVEIVGADHQNKPDVGSNIVRTWIDVDKVDVIVDVPTSSVALAVNEIVREKNKVFLVSGAAASDLTGAKCSPNTVHWTYDTWALANGTGKAVVKTGGDTWFFLTADYAFGHALERDTAAVVEANGGKVVGKVRHPFPATDFSSFLLQAQSSKAKIIGLANAGADTINAIKQASEFGIVRGGQNLAGLLVFITDVHALGLPTAQGLIMTEALVLGPQRRQSRVRQEVRAPVPERASHHGPCRRLFGRYALLEGGRGAQERCRRQGRGRQDEGDADRRQAVRQGHRSRGRPQDSPHVSVRGEEAGGVEGTVGLLQGPRHHPGGRGVPSAEGRRLSAGQRLSDAGDAFRACPCGSVPHAAGGAAQKHDGAARSTPPRRPSSGRSVCGTSAIRSAAAGGIVSALGGSRHESDQSEHA